MVIGSGATAATIIPAIAGRCDHVTMLQRSPTYYITGRNANALTDTLRELDVSEEWIHGITPERSSSIRLLSHAAVSANRTPSRRTCFQRSAHTSAKITMSNSLLAEVPALEAARRLHPGRRSFPGDPLGKSLRGHG